MQIHELNNFTGTLGAGSYVAIDDGNDTGKVSTQQILANTEARIDNIIAGEAPSAAEVTDARYGADGVTYTSLGTAIRTQFTDVKSDLEAEQDDGMFHRYLTWEHGGIDNETGLNNNEGSLVRSRMPEYLLIKDFYKIANGTSNPAYVIYYKDDKTFHHSQTISSGSEALIQQNTRPTCKYFRIDLRASLNKTALVKTYQDTPLTPCNLTQIYFKNDNCYIEENTNVKKVYFRANQIIVRYGRNGLVHTQIERDMPTLANELGVSLVTSPLGVDECIEIGDEYGLVYNYTTEGFEILSRPNFTNNHIVVLAQNGGLVVDGIPYVMHFKPNMIAEKTIPAYWDSAISEAKYFINSYLASDEKSASFAFVTDTHIGSNKGYSGALLNKVMTDCHIPVWFHGGDAVSGNGIISAYSLIGEMNADFEQFKEIENIGLRAIGNHDPAFGVSSNYDSNLRNSEINHYYHGADREKYLQIYGSKKGYFYKDIAKDKFRCIVLDIIPYESQVDANDLVTGSNKMWYHQFGSAQLDWFANVLGSTPEDYSVVVCSHIAPISLAELRTLDNSWNESTPIDYVQARKIAEAYALKSTYSFSGTISGDTTGDSYNINVDFASASGNFVCFFCGHTHKDFSLTLDNVLIVGTANDSIAVSVNAPSYAPNKTAGTSTEQIIDFFCILPTTRTLNVVRLGAYLAGNGKVRTFTY